MRAFVCVGVAIIATFFLIVAGIETGILDCGGQPCISQKGQSHD
ncbi:hypothetical protein CP98_03636 [Sphingobium yanoikuyae]|uniref:Uncharacterized protein n=1 Tax=Sphingobium yanoikuyae TaxID=13690 RepID=A0A084EGP6_SPHYA|nr:hypothetical protein [Sphingobium yanoikuyae]KEZ17138.1 hypothetical protein CP98_03636 [Sphingobium yanoikuyae]